MDRATRGPPRREGGLASRCPGTGPAFGRCWSGVRIPPLGSRWILGGSASGVPGGGPAGRAPATSEAV
eukprot:7172501-Pyramimonas_sp.AAC.1